MFEMFLSPDCSNKLINCLIIGVEGEAWFVVGVRINKEGIIKSDKALLVIKARQFKIIEIVLWIGGRDDYYDLEL